MPRAVHRLEPPGLALVLDEEHVLAELLPVAGGDPELRVVDQRRLHLDVAAARVLPAAEILERVPDHHALRVPERRARRVLVEVDEVELDAEAAMVAPLRLLERGEVGVEVGLVVEGGAVDPRQLRVVRVAAPVRAGEAGELHGLDRLRVLQVRAAAEVGEVALRVEGDRPVGGVDELDLVRLALGLEPGARLVGRYLLARPRAALGELAAELLLDPLERLLADRLGELEVVVEAVVDRRPDRDLHARVEPPDGLGKQVRGRVAEDGERVRVGSCPAWSGSGSAGRRRAARAGPARSRSSARARPARRASGRWRARRRGRWRRREVRARSCRVGRPS